MSIGGWRSAVAGVEEGGQAGVVCVLAGEESLSVLSWRQQAGLRGKTSKRVRAQQSRRHPVGLLGRILHADGTDFKL